MRRVTRSTAQKLPRALCLSCYRATLIAAEQLGRASSQLLRRSLPQTSSGAAACASAQFLV